MVTDGNGTVKARHDFLPYGEEIAPSIGGRSSIAGYGGNDGVKQLFTSKERDAESGLDYFLARYYSGAQGRFTSIDPADGEVGAPQSWNRYTYTLNNPLKYTDPTGEKWAVQYDDGKALFRWYDGDTIPGDWQGQWKEYAEGWYIGSETAIRLGSRGPNDVLVLTKDLFSNEDWGKLQNTDPANLSHEQREILFSGTTYRMDQVETIRRMTFVAEMGGYLISSVISPGRIAGGQSKINPSNLKFDGHALSSMAKRGWTKQEVIEAVTSGKQFPAIDKTAGGTSATRFVHPTTGKSVVVNNATGKVIHVGGQGFKY